VLTNNLTIDASVFRLSLSASVFHSCLPKITIGDGFFTRA